MFKHLAILSVTLCSLPALASAADIVPAGYDWSGPYIGLHAGYLTSRSDIFDVGVLTESDVDTSGFVGGGLIGYNYQMDQLVVGLEGDFGWSNAVGHGNVQAATPNTYNMMWDGHARVRLGIAPNNGPFLLYLAGGLAFADFKLTDGETGLEKSATYVGTSIGAGGEYAFTESLSGRVEYMYDDYSGHLFGAENWVVANDYSAKLKNASTIRAAISFKF